MRKTILVAGALGIGMAFTTMADEVIDRSLITASASSAWNDRTADKLLDGQTSNLVASCEWLSQDQPGTVPTAVSNQWVRFDLGHVYTLTRLKIWNDNDWVPGVGDWTTRGAKSVLIQTSATLNGTYTTVPGITGWDVNGNLAPSPYEDPYVHPNVLVFPAGIKARYVRIFINSNYGISDIGTSDKMVGLAEVEFWHNDPPWMAVIPSSNITASASSEYDGTRTAAKLLDGYTDMDYHHEWLSAPQSGPQTPYVSNQWVRFDLGQAYTLLKMKIWNYNEWSGGDWTYRGVKGALIQTSDTLNGTYTTVPGITGWDLNGNLARSPYEDPYVHPNVLVFPDSVKARYVRILVKSNWDADTGPFVGLVEVEFWQIYPSPGTVFNVR
jgi:hypothetical protein